MTAKHGPKDESIDSKAVRPPVLAPTEVEAAILQSPDRPVEIAMYPGETIAADMQVYRGAFKGNIEFGKEDSGRNLPHGVIVDNIGLNGLLIPEGKDSQEFFLRAAPWLEPQSRWFHIRATVAGNPTSIPLRLTIRARDSDTDSLAFVPSPAEGNKTEEK
jgi:hypothetical protein